MIIKSVKLENFRNYDDLYLEFNNKINIIIGNNAQGKTNLIESIYLSSMAKSFRTNNSSDMVKFDKEFTKIKVTAEKDETDKKIEIIIEKNSRKRIKKDGKVIKKTSELLDNIIIVIFSPDDLSIVKNDPSVRRAFIDRELCQLKPKYYLSLLSYNKTLRQRNSLLKEIRIDESLIDVLDYQLAKYGSIISRYREAFCIELDKTSKEIQYNITNNKEKLEIKYKRKTEDLSEEGLFKELVNNRKKDKEKGYTSIGPHRDDLIFYVNDKDVRKYGSQGQQRTCALTLKLAEIDLIKKETGENPVLLLDDVLSELDNERQNLLIEKIEDIQIFITTTEIPKQYKTKEEIKIIRIEKGKVKTEE